MKKIDFFWVADCHIVGKVGAINWTIGKLLNIVLLTIILVMVIYGITTGGLNPLKENLELKFEEVLIMFNLGKGASSGDCYTSKVGDLGGGDEFLERTGLKGKNVLLGICDDGSCEMSWKSGPSYRVKSGDFEILAGEFWVSSDFILSGDSDEAKFNWGMYNGAMNVLDGTAVREIYNGQVTKSFEVYGDGAGPFDSEVVAIWRNNVWLIKEGAKLIYDRNDDEVALDLISRYVDDFYDDAVFYRESAVEIKGVESIGSGYPSKEYIERSKKSLSGEGSWKTINELVGGDNIELDSDGEKALLKSEFLKIKKRLLSEAVLQADNVSRLKSIVEGKSFEVDGKVFEMGVEESVVGYIITLSSGGEKYGLRFNADEELVSGDVKLRDYPLSLVSYGGAGWSDVGDEENYKLYDSYFKERYNGDLVEEFLRSKCR